MRLHCLSMSMIPGGNVAHVHSLRINSIHRKPKIAFATLSSTNKTPPNIINNQSKMTSFIRSKISIVAIAMSLVASSQAAYYLTTRARPSMSLDRMMYPRRESLFSREVIRGFDEMFDSMNTMMDFDDMFFGPLEMHKRLMSRSPSLLPGVPDASSLALRMPKQTYEIAQDEKQIQIKVEVPGTAEAGDINLQMDDENRLLTISGKTALEDNGVSVHSSFQRSFSMNPDIDTANISAHMEHGVLMITAPKFESVKPSVRRIDIVDADKDKVISGAGSGEVTHETDAPVLEKEAQKKQVADEAIIDLDME